MKTRFTTAAMTRIAILAALAAILFFIEIPIVLFYKIDLSNLPVLLGGFSLGPVAGSIILAIKSLTGLLHSTTGGVGELADFLQGLAFVLPAALFYQHHKTRKGALIGMLIGTLSMVLAGILSNVYILIPLLMPVEKVVAMGKGVLASIDSIWDFAFLIVAPFNLLKGIVLSLLTFVIYKFLSPFLHGRKK